MHHPSFVNDPLKDEVLAFASWGLAWGTNPTHGSGERRFIRFCLLHRLVHDTGDILPASGGTLIYFASYLARSVPHSTIKLYLAAVAVVVGKAVALESSLGYPSLSRAAMDLQSTGYARGFTYHPSLAPSVVGPQGFLYGLGSVLR